MNLEGASFRSSGCGLPVSRYVQVRLILLRTSKAALRRPKVDVNHWKTLDSNSEEQVFNC